MICGGTGRVLHMLRRWRDGTSGNVAVMSAFVFPVCLVMAAYGVDKGALYFERRELQAATDVAAIVAAANIGMADEAARRALGDNGITLAAMGSGEGLESGEIGRAAEISVVTGNYVADRSLPRDARFRASGSPQNAAMVTVRRRGSLYFAASFSEAPIMQTTAVAQSQAEAAFSVGSRLASLNGGIVNQVLGGLTGSTLSLDLMDYEALIDAKVNAFQFLDQLATQLDLTAATYDDVLKANASIGDIAFALSKGVDSGMAAMALHELEKATRESDLSVPLAKLFDLGDAGRLTVGQSAAAFDATLQAFDIVGAAIAVADGKHQAVVDLGASLPGLASATVTLSIGEPPQNSAWFAVGSQGAMVHTAQTRLKAVVKAGGSGVLAGTTVALPVYLELASASAELTGVSCPSGQPSSAVVTLGVTPAAAEAWIGDVDQRDMDDFSRHAKVGSATLIGTPLIKATGFAHAAMSNLHPATVTFEAGDIGRATPKSVATEDFTGSLTATLIGELDLKVTTGGLALGTPAAVTSAIASLLSSVAPAVDGVLASSLGALGLKIGEADVWVNGVRCQRAVLVQ